MKKLALVVLAAACGHSTVSVGDLQEVMIAPEVPTHELDVLFVVDDSSSMLDKQNELRARFPRMMTQLASLPGGMPDLHIAVVTTDLGTSAANGQYAPAIPGAIGGCAADGDNGQFHTADLVDGSYIVAGATQNFTGALEDAFSAITDVGQAGCGFEQPIAAATRALVRPDNAGFLRPEANLLVVIVSDEDDCSMQSPGLISTDVSQLGPLQNFRCTHYGVICDDGGATPDAMNAPGAKGQCHASPDTTYLASVEDTAARWKALKSDPSKVMVAVVAGPADPFEVVLQPPPGSSTPIPMLAHSCNGTGAGDSWVADPAVRLADLAAQFPQRNAVESMCDSDLTLPLTDIGIDARTMMGDTCITTPLFDTDDSAGVQPSCTVTEHDVTVPPCSARTQTDCFTIAADPSCPLADHLKLTIHRAQPDPTAYAHLACLTP